MATISRTARSAARRALHLLFPSWRRTAIALAVEVAALFAHLPPLVHLAVAAMAHVLIAAWPRRRPRRLAN